MSYDFGIPANLGAMMRLAKRQEEVTIQPIEYIKWDKQYEFADFDLEATSGPELLGVSTKPEFDYGEAL